MYIENILNLSDAISITEEDLIVLEGQNKLREGVKIKMEKAGK